MARTGFLSATPPNKLKKPTYAAILQHFKNKRRAHITAARNGKDRKLSDRAQSAIQASAVNRMLTGHGYVVTESAMTQGDGFFEDTKEMVGLNVNRYIQDELNRLVFYRLESKEQTNLAYDNRVDSLELLHGEERAQGHCQQYYAEYEMLQQYMFELDFRKMIFFLPAREIEALRTHKRAELLQVVAKDLFLLPPAEFEKQRQCVLRDLHPEHDQGMDETLHGAPSSADNDSLEYLAGLLGPADMLRFRVLEKMDQHCQNVRSVLRCMANPASMGVPEILHAQRSMGEPQGGSNNQLNFSTREPHPVSERLFNMITRPLESCLATSPRDSLSNPDALATPAQAQAPVQAPIQAPIQAPVQAPVQTPIQAPIQAPVQVPAAASAFQSAFVSAGPSSGPAPVRFGRNDPIPSGPPAAVPDPSGPPDSEQNRSAPNTLQTVADYLHKTTGKQYTLDGPGPAQPIQLLPTPKNSDPAPRDADLFEFVHLGSPLPNPEPFGEPAPSLPSPALDVLDPAPSELPQPTPDMAEQAQPSLPEPTQDILDSDELGLPEPTQEMIDSVELDLSGPTQEMIDSDEFYLSKPTPDMAEQAQPSLPQPTPNNVGPAESGLPQPNIPDPVQAGLPKSVPNMSNPIEPDLPLSDPNIFNPALLGLPGPTTNMLPQDQSSLPQSASNVFPQSSMPGPTNTFVQPSLPQSTNMSAQPQSNLRQSAPNVFPQSSLPQSTNMSAQPQSNLRQSAPNVFPQSSLPQSTNVFPQPQPDLRQSAPNVFPQVQSGLPQTATNMVDPSLSGMPFQADMAGLGLLNQTNCGLPQSGLQPGLQPGLPQFDQQSGFQSNLQPGLSQPGLPQFGQQSGLQPGLQSGLQSGLQPGLPQFDQQSGFQSNPQLGLSQPGLPQFGQQYNLQPGLPQFGQQSGLQPTLQPGMGVNVPTQASLANFGQNMMTGQVGQQQQFPGGMNIQPQMQANQPFFNNPQGWPMANNQPAMVQQSQPLERPRTLLSMDGQAVPLTDAEFKQTAHGMVIESVQNGWCGAMSS